MLGCIFPFYNRINNIPWFYGAVGVPIPRGLEGLGPDSWSGLWVSRYSSVMLQAGRDFPEVLPLVIIRSTSLYADSGDAPSLPPTFSAKGDSSLV